MHKSGFLILLLAALPAAAKQHSAFYPPALIQRARANAARYPWAAQIRDQILHQAQPWLKFSDVQLWDMMFGATITRSHMVWSAGFCPACRRPVPMYDWQIDAFARPWKVRCPHCQQLFPKNDFYKFYRSGLDEHGVFDPKRADRSLLFNTEHPDPADPLHRFGVDDGEGYVEGDHRWRFIGAYVQYGQWWQLVLGGIENLAAAYAVSGEPVYAHKAAVLIDRVADVFPTFDFGAQGLVYELRRYGGGVAGYVTYAIDSAYDVRKLALAYDQIFDSLAHDPDLVPFLARQAAQHRLANPKTSLADVERNVEDRILRDVLSHPEKIRTNYPGTEGVLAMIKTVLAWPDNRAEVLSDIDQIVDAGTAVDGLSGEKGLAGYAAIAPHFLGDFLELYSRADPGLVAEMLKRHPKFRQTYRFFVDTWCAGRQYYPNVGDSGAFAARNTHYAGLSFLRGVPEGKMEIDPPVSMFTYLWRLYKATGDPVHLQILRLGNGNTVEGLPWDVYAQDPAALVRDVEQVVAREGSWPKVASVNKQEWHIAILRPPRDPDAGAAWMAYDSIPTGKLKGHFHYNAMNLGLYAKGFDLLPEFGYPAVQFGSWHTPQALWHKMTAAHNTVVVDGKNQLGGDGTTTLWADGDQFRAVRASSPAQVQGKVYERSLAMVNTSDDDFYVLDVFHVVGGADHAKFTHSSFATLSTNGLSLQPAPDYGHETLTRHFREDPHPQPGWRADWKMSERPDLHLRYTDLTTGAEAYTCESWTIRNLASVEQVWIPTIVVRRHGPAPLESTFVSVLEPYAKTPLLTSIRRLSLTGVAVEAQLADGRRDVWLTGGATEAGGVKLSGDTAWVRWGRAGKVERIALCQGDSLSAGGVTVRLKRKTDFVEITMQDGRATLRAGKPEAVAEIRTESH